MDIAQQLAGGRKVYSAICAITAELGKIGIAKDRKNDAQGYKFRGIDDVYAALSPLLAKHHLCVMPRVIDRHQVERHNAKGTALFYTTLTVEFDIVHAEDGSSHTVRMIGEAMDSGDKSSNKAQSAAYKYMAMEVFCIPTEGDNDADATTHEVRGTPWTDTLKDLAAEAAGKGLKAYQAFWEGLSKEARATLVQTVEHADYKTAARNVDAETMKQAA